MKYVDRLIWASIVVVIGAIALPAAVPALVTAVIVGTVCFIAIRVALYLTTNRW
jgi:hypothetical protein